MSQALSPRLTSAARLHWQIRALPLASLSGAIDAGPVLVVAPHPDDETLGCGGMIAAACDAGRPVFVLVLTDGSASHPKSKAYPAPRLRRLRETESREAARQLGLPAANISFLGLKDAHAPHSGDAADQAARAIADHAKACGARTIFTTWRHDPHTDHLAASLLTGRAASLCGAVVYEYPVWGYTLPPRRLLPAETITGFRLDVSAYLPAKRRAIACHKSQLGQVITDDPDGFTLDPRFVELFTSRWEAFIRVTSAG
jgi:LmbE family N-acetylglucosaminyl deacetylase